LRPSLDNNRKILINISILTAALLMIYRSEKENQPVVGISQTKDIKGVPVFNPNFRLLKKK